MSFDQQNPYAAPSPGTEGGQTSGHELGSTLSALIAKVAILMIVAGILQLAYGAAEIIKLIQVGFSGGDLMLVALFGIVPAFTTFAGITLRGVAKDGDDLKALLAGFRQLHVAFLVKGVVLILVLSIVLLGFLAAVLGVGAGFARLF